MDWKPILHNFPTRDDFIDELGGWDLGDEIDYHQSKYNPQNTEERCQHVVKDKELPDHLGGYCCYRPVWQDFDKCIWHAQTTHKPIKEIQAATQFERWLPEKYHRLSFVSRLDESYFNNLRIEDESFGLNFSGCTMANSDFQYAQASNLRFQNVDLSGSDFDSANLKRPSFSGTTMHRVNFEGAQLENAHFHSADLQEANLISATLNGSNLFRAKLTGADLQHAKLPDNVYLHQADCTDANLEGAQLEGTDLRDTNFTNAHLHQTLVRSVRLSEGTEFGKKCVYESMSDTKASGRESELNHNSDSRGSFYTLSQAVQRARNRYHWERDASDYLAKSIRVYRLYQRLLRESSLPDDIQHFRIRERHARRKLALAENRYLSWVNLSIQRWSSLYGESYWRVIGTSLGVIIIGAYLYPIFGIRDVATGAILNYGVNSINRLIFVFLKSFYFSTITFTTLGYGDLHPVGLGQAIATVQSFVGAVLIALLVFVFARQATW